MKVPHLVPDAQTVIFTRCAGGGRASLAALTLKQMGYINNWLLLLLHISRCMMILGAFGWLLLTVIEKSI